jgi:hypothetical protein
LNPLTRNTTASIQVANYAPPGNLVTYDAWIGSLNKTRATGWRWRKTYPWLKTVNIFGKLYITCETIAEFERRALAGEFEKHIFPTGGSSQT